MSNTNYKHHPDPLKPFPGDCYTYKDGTLVVASLKSISPMCVTVYDVVYFMNGVRYSCPAEEFPHLIKSLPL